MNYLAKLILILVTDCARYCRQALAAFAALLIVCSSAHAAADLIVSEVTNGTPVINKNGSYSFPVTFTVTNVGDTAMAPSWYDEVYLTTNGTVAGMVWYTYWGVLRNAELAPGASYTKTEYVTANLAPGSYTILVAADKNNDRAEANENNNQKLGNTVTFTRPDLTIGAVSAGAPVTNRDGSYSFPVTFTVTNAGQAPAKPGWYDEIYLTTDGTVAGKVWYTYWGILHNTELAPGASYTHTENVTANFAPGTYTLLLATDKNNDVAETDEANNTALGSALTFKRPDLSIGGVSAGAPVTNRDGSYSFPVTFTVTNGGEAPAKPGWYDEIYLTTDGTVAGKVWYTYWGILHNTELAPGASYTHTENVTASFAPGTYTLLLATDKNSDLAETNEANNTALGGTMTFKRPDLTVSGLVVGVPGDNADGSFTIPVSFTVTNSGHVAAQPGWYDRVHFSVDGTLDETDPYVNASGRSTPLAPGASYQVYANFVTSVGTAPGTYTVFANANGSRDLGETDTGNNTASALVTLRIRTQTTTTQTSSVNPSMVGQKTVLSATIAPPEATGSVTFRNGNTVLGTSTVSGGAASLETTFGSPGVHNISAEYSGETYYRPSSATVLAQTVNKAATGITLSSSAARVLPNQSLTVTAAVGGAAPTGLVTFKDGNVVVDTSAIYNGSATLTTSLAGLGVHSLTATYAGDANNAASVSAALSVEVVASIPAGESPTWSYGYDPKGRPNSVVDPNGQATYFYYDSLGRRIQTQQPANTGASAPTVTQFGYDGLGQLTSVTDPRNLTTTYTVTGQGDVLATASPDSGTAGSTYDAAGNLLTQTDARGKTTTYTYDTLNRLTSISYPTGVPTTFEYDGGATPVPSSIGKLTRMTDESGSTTYSYDALGRLGSKVQVVAGRTFTIGYTWGDAGGALNKLTSITYPGGSRVNYGYDQHGRVSGITVNPVNANGQGVSTSAVTLLSGVTYNAEGKVTGWLWSDGKPRTIGYDANGLVASYNLGDPLGTGAAAGLLRTLVRDPAGRITGYTHTSNGSPAAAFDQTFGYDNLDRLTTATQGSSTTGYSYDATGNRTARTIAGTSYASTISPTSNRLAQLQDATGTATINHDAAGNVVGDGSFNFTYSDRGRMASVTTAAGAVSYLYNGLEQRAKKSGPSSLVPTGASHYVYDAGQLLGEYDADGKPLYETIYLGSTPVGAMKQTGSATTSDIAVSVYNVHADHIDTPRVITRQDHTIVWRWDQAEAFGATAPDQNPTAQGVFAYNQRFPGQVFDQETGLFQNWHREYRAALGRYMESDPIGLRGGINTFAYVDGDPLARIDPTGEFFIGGAVGAAGFNAFVQFAINRWGGASTADALKCIDLRKVITSGAMGMAGPTLIGNKVFPVIASRLFGKKVGVEYGLKPIAATIGIGGLLNGLSSISEVPPLHWYSADECECTRIRNNLSEKLGPIKHVVEGLFF